MMKKKEPGIKLKGKGGVRAFAVSNKGKLIAVAQHGLKTGDAILSILDAATFETIEVIEVYDENSIYALAFTANDDLLYANNDYVVHVFDTQKMKRVDAIETAQVREIVASISSDKALCLGRYLEVWNIEADELLFRLDDYESFQVVEAGKLPRSLSWSVKSNMPDSFVSEPPAACFSAKSDHKIYYAGVNKSKIFSLDMKTKKSKTLINDGVLQAREIKVSKGDKYLAVSSRYPQGDFVWKVDTGERVAESLINDKYGSASAIDFHPSGTMLALGSIVGFLTIVDLQKEEVIFSEKIHDTGINQVRFSESGSSVMTAANDGKLIITVLPE